MMSLLHYLKKLLMPSPLTPEQKRERYLMSRYRLTRDPEQPNINWLNNRTYIIFDPLDQISVENAEREIQEFYRNTEVREATYDQLRLRQISGYVDRGKKGRTMNGVMSRISVRTSRT